MDLNGPSVRPYVLFFFFFLLFQSFNTFLSPVPGSMA